MAIAYAHVSVHTRAKAHSAVAASSYRAGVRLYDSRLGRTYDYSNRHDIAYSEILLPDGAIDAYLDREYLWNQVEAAETRVNSQVCKDIVLALPKELNREQQIELAKRFAVTHFVANGLPADIAIHDHCDGNPHAHILIPTRRLERDKFSKYKARDLNPGFAKGFVVEKDFWGEQWREMQNDYFREHNIDLSVDLNHVIPERHRGKHRNSDNHYLREENKLIEEVRRDIARGRVDVFIKHLSTQCSVFTRRDVEKLLFKTFQNSQDLQEYLNVMERILGHKEIVLLGKNDRGQESYTTREQYRLEARLHDDVEALMSRYRCKTGQPLDSLSTQYHLSSEQSEALSHIIESPDISVVIGRPGTGKSYLLKPVKDYFEAQEQVVIGASLSGKVAKALQAETGIASSTIASLAWRLNNDRIQLTDKHVIVIDEAGMVDVNNMAFLMREAKKAGSKVVLIGDPDQLKPIHKGEIFRGIAALTGYFELENIKRQQDAGDRQASRDLSKGKIIDAIQHYDDKGAITISDNAITDLIDDWDKNLQSHSVRDTVLLAFSRKAVRELNDQARERLQAKGEIGQENIVYQGFEREIQISTGDRLLFRENNKSLGLRNGDAGTVKSVNHSSFNVELDSGEQLTVPRDYRAIDYGYALTVHKSQGMTAKQAQVLIDSKYWDRNLSYVAFSRHKEGLKIYTDKVNHANKYELVETLSRRSIRDNVIDWPLDYSTRCGFNPDKLIGRVVNYLAGISQGIKNKFNYVIEFEMGNLKNNVQEKSIETSQLENLLEKRQHLKGYFAEKMDKKIIEATHNLMSDKTKLANIDPKLLNKLHALIKTEQSREIEN
ncbi:Ti-type conjugative transfer relaxase TraA [Legionella pneumophila serogroup 1]